MNVVTMAAGFVAPERVADLRAGYDALASQPVPDGLLESTLLEGEDGDWAVVTVWRDRAALRNLRASGAPPAALKLFTDVGAQPRVAVFDVAARLAP